MVSTYLVLHSGFAHWTCNVGVASKSLDSSFFPYTLYPISVANTDTRNLFHLMIHILPKSYHLSGFSSLGLMLPSPQMCEALHSVRKMHLSRVKKHQSSAELSKSNNKRHAIEIDGFKNAGVVAIRMKGPSVLRGDQS